MKSIKKFLLFSGRSTRYEFWTLCIIPSVIVGISDAFIRSMPSSVFKVVLIIAIIIPWIWTSLAVQVKRWHDLGYSGFLVLINLIPVIGFLASLIMLGFIKGKDVANKYGDPL